MASFKEFGEVIEDSQPGFKEFGTLVTEAAPLAREKKPSLPRALAKQAAIGVAEGAIATPGDILSLLGVNIPGPLPGELARIEAGFEQPELLPFLADDDLAPPAAGLPTSETIKSLLSLFGVQTEPEGVAERTARRVGGGLGAGALFGAGPLGTAALGAAAIPGQLVEEVAGPGAGIAAEFVSLLAPGAFAKKLMPRRAQKPLVETAKRVGIEERQLAPLLKDKKSVRLLGRFANKGPKAQAYLSDIREGLGNAYGVLKEEAVKAGSLSPREQRGIARGMHRVEKNLGKSLVGTEKEQVLKAVRSLRDQVVSGKATGADLIDYWQEVNASINWNKVRGGKKQLAEVKTVLRSALENISPQLLNDFENVNKLYGNLSNLAASLKPGKIDEWISLVKKLEVIGPAITGNVTGAVKGLGAVVVEEAAQKAILRYMMSPRTNNILKKAVTLTNQGKTNQAQQLLRNLEKNLRRELEAEEA